MSVLQSNCDNTLLPWIGNAVYHTLKFIMIKKYHDNLRNNVIETQKNTWKLVEMLHKYTKIISLLSCYWAVSDWLGNIWLMLDNTIILEEYIMNRSSQGREIHDKLANFHSTMHIHHNALIVTPYTSLWYYVAKHRYCTYKLQPVAWCMCESKALLVTVSCTLYILVYHICAELAAILVMYWYLCLNNVGRVL